MLPKPPLLPPLLPPLDLLPPPDLTRRTCCPCRGRRRRWRRQRARPRRSARACTRGEPLTPAAALASLLRYRAAHTAPSGSSLGANIRSPDPHKALCTDRRGKEGISTIRVMFIIRGARLTARHVPSLRDGPKIEARGFGPSLSSHVRIVCRADHIRQRVRPTEGRELP